MGPIWQPHATSANSGCRRQDFLPHLFLPPRIVEEADQFTDIARLQTGPGDAQLFGPRVHGRAVAPQRGGERNHGEGIGAGAQLGTVACTLGARAVTTRAAAFGEDAFPQKRRARGFKTAQAGQEAEYVRDLLALERGGCQARFAGMLEHGGSVIPEHRGELPGGAREFVAGSQLRTDLAAFAAHRIALDALGLEDFPTVVRTAAQVAVFLNG